MALDREQYLLNEDVHQTIFEKEIKSELFDGVIPSNQPIAVIFGGQPGAGKSAAIEAVLAALEQRGGAVEIIGDDLRSFHPQYSPLMDRDDKTAAFYTDLDTGRWVEKAIAEAKAMRVNLVIEGTMRDSNKVAATMQSLRSAGYEIDARALAVNNRLSEQGILQRYENQKIDRGAGRMTTPEAHQAAYEGMLVTLERIEHEKLADRVTIYRRGAEAIYSNELQDNQWMNEPQARAVVEAERQRPMTLQERREYDEGYEKLAKMIAKPERKASIEEITAIGQLRIQARAGLAAEVFRQEKPENALKQHPELAPAYVYMRALEAKAIADGLPKNQHSFVLDRMRNLVAERIERGDIPQKHMKEIKPSKQQNLER